MSGMERLTREGYLSNPSQACTPRTPFAATGLGQEHTFSEPTPGEEERVFFHEEMERRVSIVNPAIDTRMTISWSDTLPILSHWRRMACGDYVCGLEPSNTCIMGRRQRTRERHAADPAAV